MGGARVQRAIRPPDGSLIRLAQTTKTHFRTNGWGLPMRVLKAPENSRAVLRSRVASVDRITVMSIARASRTQGRSSLHSSPPTQLKGLETSTIESRPRSPLNEMIEHVTANTAQ